MVKFNNKKKALFMINGIGLKPTIRLVRLDREKNTTLVEYN